MSMEINWQPLFIKLHGNGFTVNFDELAELSKNRKIGRVHIGGVPKTQECRIYKVSMDTITFEDINCSDVKFTFKINKLGSPLDLYEFVAYEGCMIHYPEFVHHRMFFENKDVRLNPWVVPGAFIHLEEPDLDVNKQNINHDVLIYKIDRESKGNKRVVISGVHYNNCSEKLEHMLIIWDPNRYGVVTIKTTKQQFDTALDLIRVHVYERKKI